MIIERRSIMDKKYVDHNAIIEQIAKIKDLPSPDYDFLREKILVMYSNPLKNKLKLD